MGDLELKWIEAWDEFVILFKKLHPGKNLPGFPLWADEWVSVKALKIPRGTPKWKSAFLLKNAEFYTQNKKFIDKFESKRKKISINGVEYKSVSDACKDLKKSHDYILWRLQSKSYTNWIYITESITNKEVERGPVKFKSVSIKGIIYESISKAAEGSGIDRQIMRYRLKSDNYPDYFYI